MSKGEPRVHILNQAHYIMPAGDMIWPRAADPGEDGTDPDPPLERKNPWSGSDLITFTQNDQNCSYYCFFITLVE